MDCRSAECSRVMLRGERIERGVPSQMLGASRKIVMFGFFSCVRHRTLRADYFNYDGAIFAGFKFA